MAVKPCSPWETLPHGPHISHPPGHKVQKRWPYWWPKPWSWAILTHTPREGQPARTHAVISSVRQSVRLVDLDLCEPSWLSGFAAEHDRLSVWIDEFEDWLKTSTVGGGIA